jgi:hypothetical protein
VVTFSPGRTDRPSCLVRPSRDVVLSEELVQEAIAYLDGRIRGTPWSCRPLGRAIVGAPIWVKLEFLQITGPFKLRGTLSDGSTDRCGKKQRLRDLVGGEFMARRLPSRRGTSAYTPRCVCRILSLRRSIAACFQGYCRGRSSWELNDRLGETGMIVILAAAVVVIGGATGVCVVRSAEVRKILARAFFVSAGIQFYLYLAGVSVPLLGTGFVQTPELSGARSIVHMVRFAITWDFGFVNKPTSHPD